MTSTETMTSPNGGLRLSTTGKNILDSVLSAASLELYDLPARHIVTTGPAVFDCEQVAVSLLRVETGLGLNPGGELVQGGPSCDVGWSLMCEVAIVRCGPTPSQRSGIITPAKTFEACEQSSKDVFILMTAIENVASELYGGFSVTIIPEQIEGGFVATSASIRMVL